MKFGNEFWLIFFREYISPKLFAVWQTHVPGRLTCPADSFARQTHFPGRLTCPEDSIARQTHLSGKLICSADSLARPAHLPDVGADDASLMQTNVQYYT